MPPALEMLNITKTFPGVTALRKASLTVDAGEIHAIVGENGAGKSTLMKILSGAYPCDSGDIRLFGTPVAFASPADAIRHHIGVVYQELPLIPTLSVIANVYLGSEPTRGFNAIDQRALRERYDALGQRCGIYVAPDRVVRDLTVGERQLVEILKILQRQARLIVLDEPTASLDGVAKDALFRTVRHLREQGTTFIFISHFLEDVLMLADRVTVLKDGEVVTTVPSSNVTLSGLITLMIGHRADEQTFESPVLEQATPLLTLTDVAIPPSLGPLSFRLHPGEVLGITGMAGSGTNALAQALVGDPPFSRGEVQVNGRSAALTSPAQAMRHGLALLPADRKQRGLLLRMALYKNASLSALRRFSRYLVLNVAAERTHAKQHMASLDIRAASELQTVGELSGGNQQKVVLARILATDAPLLVLHEPTQGVDVGAKAEIFRLVRELAHAGKGILLISAEFKEVAAICDRSLVLRQGRIVAEFPRSLATEGRLIEAAMTGRSA